MAKRNLTLAVAIVFALVALLPAWGQTGTIVWTTVPVEFGLNPDGTTSVTEFSIVNRDSVIHTINFRITDAENNLSGATAVDQEGNLWTPAYGSVYNIPPFSTTRWVVTALPWVPNAVPSLFSIETLLGTDGLPVVVGSARIVHNDASGNAVSLASAADPSTVEKTSGTAFGFPAVFGVGYESILSLSTRSANANVTVTVRPCQAVDPSMVSPSSWPTTQISVGRAVTMRTLSQLFPGVTWTNTLVTVVSDELVTVGVVQQSLNSGSPATSVVSAANFFPIPALATTPSPSPALRTFSER